MDGGDVYGQRPCYGVETLQNYLSRYTDADGGSSVRAQIPMIGRTSRRRIGWATGKDQYFIQALAQHGVEVWEGAGTSFAERFRGVQTDSVPSSRNCAEAIDSAGLTRLFDVQPHGVDLRRPEVSMRWVMR